MKNTTQAAKLLDLTSWDDVDAVIRRMGEIDIATERINGEAVLKINDIKEMAKQRTAGMADERKALTFGAIGYRIVTKVPLPKDKGKVAALLSALKAFSLFDCIKTVETPDRDRIADLDEATIARLGLSRTTRDSFRVVPDIEAIQSNSEAA